jgi:hypothetical protein
MAVRWIVAEHEVAASEHSGDGVVAGFPEVDFTKQFRSKFTDKT